MVLEAKKQADNANAPLTHTRLISSLRTNAVFSGASAYDRCCERLDCVR